MAEIEGATHSTEFAKELGLKESVAIAVGAMIGGGIFSVLGRLAHIAGPAASVSFFLGGVISFLTANSYYRLVSKYPSAGGEFVILRRGFKNPLIGNYIGIMLWLGYSVTIALYAFTFGLYVSEYFYQVTGHIFFSPAHHAVFTGRKLFAFISILIFALINLKGVKETGGVQNLIVAFKLSVLMFVGFLGLALLKPGRYHPFTNNVDPYGLANHDLFGGWGGIIIGSAVIYISYEGFQVISNTVPEMKNPAKDVKTGMYLSVIIVTLTYVIVTIATFSLVDNPHAIDEAALIQAVEFVGPWAVLLVTLGAAASTTSAINATLLGSSRLAYTMADWSAFPKRLAVISEKTKVPYLAIIITSLISWFFTFFGNANEIAEAGSIIFLGIFLTINVSAIKIFPEEKNYAAKAGAVLIGIYMLLVIGFFATHIKESKLSILVVIIFTMLTLTWNHYNRHNAETADVDRSKYEMPPLGIELIEEFTVRNMQTDEFFVDLDNMLVPVSGERFETKSWQISALLARKYNVHVTLLHVGEDEKILKSAKEVFDKFGVKYETILKQGKDVVQIIIDTFHEGNYQLVCLASRRKKGFFSRLFEVSISKEVVDAVEAPILQIHPPKYGQGKEDIENMFLLFDGTERDSYLARWAKLISSAGSSSKSYAYHFVEIPQTISLADAAQTPAVKRSADNFTKYAKEITQVLNLDAEYTLLYGNDFVSSLVQATENHEPDAVLIGHTKDEGLWNQLRTRLAYRIMNKVDSAVIVFHLPEKKSS